MDTLIDTSCLYWYISTACRKCCSSSKYKTIGYISLQFHVFFDENFTTTSARITNKPPENWDDLFKNHCELPHEKFQFSIEKQRTTPTDRSEGNHKVNHYSPSIQTEGDISHSTGANLSPQREHVEAINRHNSNSSSGMAQEGDNDNDEYYIPIQTISGRIFVKPNQFGQATAISLGLLTCQYNDFLQTSRQGSIEDIKNESVNVSIFKAPNDHMDLISRKIMTDLFILRTQQFLQLKLSRKIISIWFNQ